MSKLILEICLVGDAHDVVSCCDSIMDSINPIYLAEVEIVVRNEEIFDDA